MLYCARFPSIGLENMRNRIWVIGGGVLCALLVLVGLAWPELGIGTNPFQELLKLVVAGGLGLTLTSVQNLSKREKALNRSAEQAQILLCVAGAMMMIIIGDSFARALGIAGGATIIRFRTPVKDPKDAIILLLLLGLGMSCGLGNFAVAGLGTAFVSVVLVLLDNVGREKRRRMILEMVAEGREFPAEQVQKIFARHNISFEPRELTQGKDVVVRYQVKLDPSTSLEDLSTQLMKGSAGLKSVVWESPKQK